MKSNTLFLSVSAFTFSTLLSTAMAEIDDPHEPLDLDPFVVTGASMVSPLEASIDPTLPTQPLPAQDGADILKSIPGMSLIRKGGTDGDPVFRGMAGSRLGIQADGQICLGGCGSRMDPPTAYIFPAAYDSVRLLKGPQTVLHGPGQSAGVVLFENQSSTAQESELATSLTFGSWDRLDTSIEGIAAMDSLALSMAAVRTHSGDYSDGNGSKVHSEHTRWSIQPRLTYSPTEQTLFELSVIKSDGKAAYADRMMDGIVFDRLSYSARLRQRNISPAFEELALEVGYNYVDHVMDNFSLREFRPTQMMPNAFVSNPDRTTRLARIKARFLNNQSQGTIEIGLDHQADTHRLRSSMNQESMPYEHMLRKETAQFQQLGAFFEYTHPLTENQRLVAGLRADLWSVDDKRESIRVGMMPMQPNPTANSSKETALTSGFLRWERTGVTPADSLFIGIGHVERFPDYWELFRYEGTDSLSAFDVHPEDTTQLDMGAGFSVNNQASITVSAFYSDIRDFVLIDSTLTKSDGMTTSRQTTVARNITAKTWGTEAALSCILAKNLNLEATIAHTIGKNETDGLPLAQIPPLEATLALKWQHRGWTMGTLVRAVDQQDRVATGQGNIAGQDIGASEGFATIALHATWDPSQRVRLAFGVDNLFDETYAEHLSRAGTGVAGYIQTTRINEPGRTFWARLDIQF